MMFGDNKSVINSASIPHGKLYKGHNALAFHRTREAIATGITRYHHINGKKNPSDLLSKHWDMPSVWDSLKPLLFWQLIPWSNFTCDSTKSHEQAQPIYNEQRQIKVNNERTSSDGYTIQKWGLAGELG